MNGVVKILLVGIGGYGGNYVTELLDNQNNNLFEIVGVVDPYAENCPRLNELLDMGVKVFADINTFYEKYSADLAVISSPIHLHCRQTCECLEHGTNVLCEKPLAGSIEDGLAMAKAEKESTGFVAIGYQWSFSEAIQDIKNDIMSGIYGEALCLKTYVAWSRKKSYYKRNNWAGKIETADGFVVLDSPANNANAHYLHNMFYILGETFNSSMRPVDVQAELYRANDIENYDTVAMRVEVESGAEILFFATHAVRGNIGPLFKYEFENAILEFAFGDIIEARFTDGSIKRYADSQEGGMIKLWACIDAVRTGKDVVCGIDAALSQLFCVSLAQESEIVTFSKDMVAIDLDGDVDGGDALIWVPELHESMFECYDNNVLPSESGTWLRGRL